MKARQQNKQFTKNKKENQKTMNSEYLLNKIKGIIESVEPYKVVNSQLVNFSLQMLNDAVVVGLTAVSASYIPKTSNKGVKYTDIEYMLQLYFVRHPTKIECISDLGFTKQYDNDEGFVNAVFSKLEDDSDDDIGCCTPTYKKGTIKILRGNDEIANAAGLVQLKGLYWIQCDVIVIEEQINNDYKKYFL